MNNYLVTFKHGKVAEVLLKEMGHKVVYPGVNQVVVYAQSFNDAVEMAENAVNVSTLYLHVFANIDLTQHFIVAATTYEKALQQLEEDEIDPAPLYYMFCNYSGETLTIG